MGCQVKTEVGMGQGTRIRILMLEKGIRQRNLARKHKLWESDISRVIDGKRNIGRIQRIIARELGLKVADLFGKHEGGSSAKVAQRVAQSEMQ